MKANNGSGNIESRDSWETPFFLFEELHKQFNFTHDCCATKENCKCARYFPDFKKVDYTFTHYVCWMNPPFSKALEMFKHFFKVVHKGVAIYRCDNFETKIWQKVIFPNASWVFIPNKRIAYEGMQGSGSRFPSALIGFNVPVIESLDGITLKPYGVFNKDLTATQQVATPKCPSDTSLNPDIKLNSVPNLLGGVQLNNLDYITI
ncbi:MAG: DNA N-6-adenine-methyltransferase [Bacillota bacterium]